MYWEKEKVEGDQHMGSAGSTRQGFDYELAGFTSPCFFGTPQLFPSTISTSIAYGYG
jgi:hypothetical protein